MKKLSYKKNRNRLWIAAAGVLLALLHVWVKNTTFSINCNHAHYYPDLYDFLNYILVGKDIGKICYLEYTDLELFLQPISFLVFGLFIAGSYFLSKPTGYFQYCYTRYRNEKTFIKALRQEHLSWIFIYSITYYVTLFVVGCRCSYQIHNWKAILSAISIGILMKILFFVMMKELMLLYFLKKGLISAILSGILGSIILLMMNVAMSGIKMNVLLFSDQVSIAGILFLIIGYIILRIVNKKVDLLELEHI